MAEARCLTHFGLNMQSGDGKILAVVVSNVSLNGVTLFIQKALPVLSFILVILQIVAAVYAVYHIFKKRKNEKIPTPPDI